MSILEYHAQIKVAQSSANRKLRILFRTFQSLLNLDVLLNLFVAGIESIVVNPQTLENTDYVTIEDLDHLFDVSGLI